MDAHAEVQEWHKVDFPRTLFKYDDPGQFIWMNLRALGRLFVEINN